jgi:hypothetical protein
MQIYLEDRFVDGGNGNGADIGFFCRVVYFGGPEFDFPYDAVVGVL